jgi:hypothetical protein
VLTRDVTSSMPTLVVITRYLDKFCSVDPVGDRVYQQKNAMRLHTPRDVVGVLYDYRVTYSHDYLFTYDHQSYGGWGVFKNIYDWSNFPADWHIKFHVPSQQDAL